MGRHADAARRRGLARWVIAVIVFVLVLAGGTTAYLLIVNRDNPATAAGACTGTVVLQVVASTGAAPSMTAAGTAFDGTAPVARSTCVTTSVSAAPGAGVAANLEGDWTGEALPPPAVWASDSETDVTALERTRSDLTSGRDDQPLATSPVVLAVQAPDALAVEGLSWSKLARAVGPGGSVQLPSGEPLTLALPDPMTNRATAYALESMLATGGGALTPAVVTAARATLTKLAGNSDLTPTTTLAALQELHSGTAAFSAVPVVESELAEYNSTATGPLTAVYPAGAAAGDQILASTLTAAWVDPTQSEAGAAFTGFLRDPAGQDVLAASHLRVAGTTSPAVGGVDFTQPVTALPAAPAGLRAVLAAALGFAGKPDPGGTAATPTASSTPPSRTTGPSTSAPTSPSTSSTGKSGTSRSGTSKSSTSKSSTGTPKSSTTNTTPKSTGPVVGLVVDTSSTMSTVVDGRSRLDYAQEGLRNAVTTLADGNAGLWSFSSTVADQGWLQLVSTGPVSGQIDGSPRTDRLAAGIQGLAPGGSRTTYAAVVAAYQSASDGAVAGRSNRVVLITDGVDQTPGVSRAQVVAQLTAIHDQGKGVELFILGVGEAAPAGALAALATAGGGTYTAVPQTPELPAAIVAAVS